MVARRRVGEIERSVKRRLRDVDLTVGMRGTLKPMAILLARAIDLYAGQLDEVGAMISSAELSAVTKAHSELRATLRALLEVGSDTGAGDESDQSALPAPVWDRPHS